MVSGQALEPLELSLRFFRITPANNEAESAPTVQGLGLRPWKPLRIRMRIKFSLFANSNFGSRGKHMTLKELNNGGL